MAKNFEQEGGTLMLTPAADVASGTGYLFGAALFGVALTNVTNGTSGPFATEGVWELPKTSALAISVGDRLYWDPAGKVVNKTTASQECIGVAVSGAANPSASVLVKLGVSVIEGT